MEDNFLLYGANGYTALLVLELCKEKGIKPTIAGRTLENIKPLAEKYNLDYEVFSVDDKSKTREILNNFGVILNCAGPFFRTFQPLAEACIDTETHYIDITGEIDVLEKAKQYSSIAEEAEIMLLPAAGFDVVPTDCLAKALHNKLPDATHLKLAFASSEFLISKGTKTTTVEKMGDGGAIRKDGKIVEVPNAYKVEKIPFIGKTLTCATIPWGDISTAYHSTGIDNIETYIAVNRQMLRSMKLGNYIGWALKARWLKNMLIKQVQSGNPGPTPEQMERAYVMVWGEVENEKKEKVTGKLIVPEAYKLTALTALSTVQKTLVGNYKIGFQTPSTAFGEDFIMEFEGVKREFS